MITLPRLYAILDDSLSPETETLYGSAKEMVAGGVTLLQYRNKSGNARQMLDQARELRAASRRFGKAHHERPGRSLYRRRIRWRAFGAG